MAAQDIRAGTAAHVPMTPVILEAIRAHVSPERGGAIAKRVSNRKMSLRILVIVEM